MRVVYEMEDSGNDYNPTYKVYEYGTLEDARASFLKRQARY